MGDEGQAEAAGTGMAPVMLAGGTGTEGAFCPGRTVNAHCSG